VRPIWHCHSITSPDLCTLAAARLLQRNCEPPSGGPLEEFFVPVHFLVRFEPLPGRESQFRDELLRVIHPTRAEPGCLGMHAFESLHEPPRFAIHSEWIDEAAFDCHANSRTPRSS
jgi:quinol monooxygenase YgiN